MLAITLRIDIYSSKSNNILRVGQGQRDFMQTGY